MTVILSTMNTPTHPHPQNRLIWLPLVLGGLYLDQASKLIFNQVLSQPVPVVGDWIRLQLEHNRGMAFSLTLPYAQQLILQIAVFLAIAVHLFRNLNFSLYKSHFIFSLLLSGALGNLIDRLARGYVIDFIAIGTFPVFNLADSFITISIFLLLLFYDRIKRPK